MKKLFYLMTIVLLLSFVAPVAYAQTPQPPIRPERPLGHAQPGNEV